MRPIVAQFARSVVCVLGTPVIRANLRNGLTDRDAAWDEDSRVPKNHGACTLAPSGNYDGICGAAMRAARCRYH